jgi:hypothetical protein
MHGVYAWLKRLWAAHETGENMQQNMYFFEQLKIC